MAMSHAGDSTGVVQPIGPSSASFANERIHEGSNRSNNDLETMQTSETRISGSIMKSKYIKVTYAVQNVISAITCWLLLQLLSLQDVLLAIGPLRWLVTYALMPRGRTVVSGKAISPASNTATFHNIQYYVSEEVQKLLLHGSLYSLVGSRSQISSTLPSVGRTLLHTGARHTTAYQKAVAAALANRLGATLLIIDEDLLRAVSRATLGCDSVDFVDSGSSGLAGVVNTLLSFVLSGGRAACVWDVLMQVAASPDAIPGPLVVLVPDAETTLCGSFERWEAFESAMDACSAHGSRSMVLLAGCSLLETAAASAGVPGSASSSSVEGFGFAAAEEDERNGAGSSGRGYSPPQDDSLSSLLPLAAELGISLDERPDPRRALSRLFPTCVRLTPPTDSAAAARHMEQLQTDAASSSVTANHASLAALAAKRGIEVPPATATIYADHTLKSKDWAKVLAWAIGLECAQHKALLALQVQTPHIAGFAVHSSANSDISTRLPTHRRSISHGQLAEGSNSCKLPLPLLPQAVVDKLSRVPGTVPHSVRAAPKSSCRASSSDETSAAALSHPVPSTSASATVDPVTVSQPALLYGIHMLRCCGTSLRGNVPIENKFERRLLSEVIQPEAAGGGFKEVGALAAAKDALREAVQLPLQHPRLFARGTLTRACTGVLLFGPPGTGKTLLARAAAAECGAAFLAISPSTLASKWLGDGVKYVRALFTLAAKLSPCVIFIDEVDAMLGKRNSHSEHEALREMKNELMAQWDGIRSTKSAAAPRVMVLGATNRPGDLDDAVLRRFSRRLFCDLPDCAARELILKVILAEENLGEDVSVSAIASATNGFSGSDLRNLCAAAAMRPVRQLLAASGKSQASKCLPASPDESAPMVPLDDSTPLPGVPVPAPSAPECVRQEYSHQQLQQLMVAEFTREFETSAAVAAADDSIVRPLSAGDFEAAQRDVSPSVATDGSVMSDLRAWDSQFGEGSKTRGWDSKLTYFM